MDSTLADPAAVFACALSLWQKCKQRASSEAPLNLSECYDGMDQFMREVMRIANVFESWACQHINFNELTAVWPYLLEEKFGDICTKMILPSALNQFDETDCLRVALRLRLPVRLDDQLRVPVDIKVPNPTPGAAFHDFRIQTIRDHLEDDDPCPFTSDDEPFDEEFSDPYFGIYGIGTDGLMEHIADRKTYSETVSLVKKLAPGVEFPTNPTLLDSLSET